MSARVQDAEKIAEKLVALAQAFPDQPVAVICESGELKAGVLALYRPGDEDWFYDPVKLSSLADMDLAAILK